jgi:hypothetical protein
MSANKRMLMAIGAVLTAAFAMLAAGCAVPFATGPAAVPPVAVS